MRTKYFSTILELKDLKYNDTIEISLYKNNELIESKNFTRIECENYLHTFRNNFNDFEFVIKNIEKV